MINVLTLRLNSSDNTRVRSLEEIILDQVLLTSRPNFRLIRITFSLMNRKIRKKKNTINKKISYNYPVRLIVALTN